MLFFGGLSRRWRAAIRARDPLFHCGGAALNWRREPVMQLVASLRQACFVVLFVSEEQGHSCELLKSLSEKRRHPPYRSLGRCCNNCQVKFKTSWNPVCCSNISNLPGMANPRLLNISNLRGKGNPRLLAMSLRNTARTGSGGGRPRVLSNKVDGSPCNF